MMAANTFSEAVRGVHRELVQAIDVSNLLLVDLEDKGVLTDAQYRHLSVSNQLCVLFKLHSVSKHVRLSELTVKI